MRTTLIKDSTRDRKSVLHEESALNVAELVANAEIFFGESCEDRRHDEL